MRKRSTLVAAAVMGLMALPAWALDGRIVQVGYPMSATFDDTLDDTSGAQKYRLGTWVPIQVELFSEENAPLFEGSLRVIQPDRDGDLAVTSEPVAVRGLRRYWLYTVAAPTRDEQPFVVHVLDADGNVITLRDSYSGKDSERLIPSSRPLALGTQDRVVLDISARPVSQLYRLASKDAYSANQADRETTQPIVIGRHAARDLPGHRCGLDLVDVIVWDAADPASLTDAAHQMRALTEWVYHGGILVLGVGQTWQTVQKSALAPLLPGPLTGTQQAETLPEMATFLDSEERSASGTTDPTALKAPITICPIARDSLRTGSRIMDFGREASDRVLVCRRR
ncbi:MAG: hypothetical protein JXA69_21160, partial [Phycisphaerae bacterium]|nr:hypothetical protein [Phycisphaerae bacterium]